jgi:hypothetical protein
MILYQQLRIKHLNDSVIVHVSGSHDIVKERISILKRMVYPSESLAKGIPIKLTPILDVEPLEEIVYSFFALGAGLLLLWTIGLSHSSPDVGLC